MKSPLCKDTGVSWYSAIDDCYMATGVDLNGKRFRLVGPWVYIKNINMVNGSRWLVRGGRRWLLQRMKQ